MQDIPIVSVSGCIECHEADEKEEQYKIKMFHRCDFWMVFTVAKLRSFYQTMAKTGPVSLPHLLV